MCDKKTKNINIKTIQVVTGDKPIFDVLNEIKPVER